MDGSQISCAALRALALNSIEQLIREQREDPELGHIYRYLENPDDGSVNANVCEERRLRRLVERFRTDSSQSPPKRKGDLFEGHKRPENKFRNQFLDLIYIPDDFNIYVYQSDTKKPPSLRERKKITT
ncbi:hypothetical protein TNCV_5022891 [Trichonephila clavipes]|nr:hypothetical protein TNCV_5022891 [Trichonephila clavipes]